MSGQDNDLSSALAATSYDDDPITGLPRLGADERSIKIALLEADQYGEQLLLLHIDLDDFASINDNMGEAIGDQALASIAQRCLRRLGSHGRLWRLASDDFIATLRVPAELSELTPLAEGLRKAIEEPMQLLPYTLQVTASIGFAVYPGDASTAANLLQCAEMAVEQAGRNGTNLVMRYTRESQIQRPRGGLARHIADALARGEFAVHYHPFVHAADGRVIGVEALLRWHSNEYGAVGPGQFLPIAEELGLMAGIGEWVFERVVEQVSSWRKAGLDDLKIAVNLSTVQLMHADFIDRIESILATADVPFSQFEIELSENTLYRNVSRVRQRLRRLRDQGMSLTLDDFGVGGAGLAQLPRYPLNKIKIDRAFVADVISDASQAAIVRAIIAMGHQMNMQVVAEGVETEAQIGFLRRNHCDQLQGYLFGEPASASAIEGLLRHRYVRSTSFSDGAQERTLLLVDDEENVLRALQRAFRREGYRILTASRINNAFELLATNQVHVIVSDQRMSDMNGTEFLGRVKELYPQTVRLVLSGYTDLATVTEAINRGAIYRFLTKPWDDDELRAHIREAFRTHDSLVRVD